MDSITIRGEKKQKNFYCMMWSYGSFKGLIPLPGGIDRDEMEAKLENILDITVPKTKEAMQETKRMQIKAK